MDVRKLALEAINKITQNSAYSNVVVNETLSKFEMSKEDRAFFTNLVYGTIQNLITIEFYLEPYINGKKTKPWIKNLLNMSVYQLLFLDIPEYAILDEAVEIAKIKDRHIGGFVNGVLRNFLRNGLRTIDSLDDIEKLSIRYSMPLWLVSYLMKDYPIDIVERILQESIVVKKDAIRVNTLKATKEDIKQILENEHIEYNDTDFVNNGLIISESVINTPMFKKGLITMQDLSSQKVAEVVDPFENAMVLDLCSAPGGKTSHMASIMNNTGMIHACDIHQHKIKLMEKNFKKLGVTNCKTQLISALEISKHVKSESFDFVLADVPCSGLGVIGHKVDLKYHISIKAIEEIKRIQKDILNSTCNLVKVGGYYIYSTCTINSEENGLQIREFLESHPNFEIVYEETILPFEHDSDGFYICKMRRCNE